MRKANLASLSLEELVARFVELSKREAYLLQCNMSTTKLFPQQQAANEEFRRRGSDARRALLPLLTFPSAWPPPMLDPEAAQVRLNAARQLLSVEPEQANETLKSLAKSGPTEQRFRARIAIDRLAQGIIKPE